MVYFEYVDLIAEDDGPYLYLRAGGKRGKGIQYQVWQVGLN
jgi:hypothetical protein